jgi:UDP-N-acetylglucosamine--N-acetylmuramyl-(pentapeptide) pyrophosphoryl-undecaprenol N-acetylglucosamine transferase
MMSRKILIMAAGTGGHIFPALAVAGNLQAHNWDVQWLGTPAGMENEVLADTGITLHRLAISGLRGKGYLSLCKAPFMLLRSVWQAWRLIRELRPCCVLGMGGYVAGPGGLAARLAGVALIIHEQNAVAGTTNRLLAPISSRVLESYPGTFAQQRHAIHTGNPVRSTISWPGELREPVSASRPLRLLVLGGSLGAAALNKLVVETAQRLPECVHIEIWHQAGKAGFEATAAAYHAAGLADKTNFRLSPFIGDMNEAYQWADLVLCRAGAGTLAEIAVAGLPSILIPFPYAIDDHQFKNGQYFVQAGAALMYREAAMNAAALAAIIKSLVSEPERLQLMSAAVCRLATPNAAAIVAGHCEEVCND